MSGKGRHFLYIVINIIMLLGYTLGAFIAGVFVSHAYAPELHGSNPPHIIDNLPNLGQPNTAYETVFIGAVLIRTYRADDREIQQVELTLSDAQETGTGKSAEATLAAEKRRATVTLSLYLSHLRQAAEHYTENQLSQALINLSRNRGKTPGGFGDRPYRSAVGRQKMAEFRVHHSDCERMLHLRARTFAPLTLSLAFTAEEDLQPFVSFTRLFVSHVVAFRRTGVIDKQQILRDLIRS